MDQFHVIGGKPLYGSIPVSGAKNAALPILVAAAILPDMPSVIHNIPRLMDIQSMCAVLEVLGSTCVLQNGNISIEPGPHEAYEAPYDLVRKMRASIYVLGPLVARLGRARVSMPGGCAFGPRPIDLHLRGLEALGAQIRVEHGYVVAHADRLRGAEINLHGPYGSSVGATANVMMAAVLAEGSTVIYDAACEPEVAELAHFLNAMGAQVEQAGSPVITIHGVDHLHGIDYRVIPDRIEAGTFMVAAAITGGELLVQHARPDHLVSVSEKLIEVGVELEWVSDGVHVRAPDLLRSVDVRTAPYPGFPTDMQAQMLGLLCLAGGISVVTESIYMERFKHVSELNRMGARIRLEGNSAIVHGVERLSGAPVMASDLRAGAVLVLAALAAEGKTVVSRVYHIDRGYEQIEKKLRMAGADIERVSV